MRVVVVGGGSWGTAFSRVLANREHDVTLACRDAEQARAIEETHRNPRYLTHCDLRGVRATTIESAPIEEAELVVVAVPSAVFGEVVRALPGDGADPVADEGARSGDRGAPLDPRRGQAGRGPLRPEHRGRDRARLPGRGRDRERRQPARARPAGGDHLAHVPRLQQRRRDRRRALRGGEERDRARRRRRRRPRARRQREGGARRARARRDGPPRGRSGRQGGDLRGPRRHGRPRRHVLVAGRPQPPRRRADRPGRSTRRRPSARSG